MFKNIFFEYDYSIQKNLSFEVQLGYCPEIWIRLERPAF